MAAYHETHEAPHCPTCDCGAPARNDMSTKPGNLDTLAEHVHGIDAGVGGDRLPADYVVARLSALWTLHNDTGDKLGACDTINAAIALITTPPAAAAPDGWLPIDSAPRDGTEVIVWFKQHGAISCSWPDSDGHPASEWAHWHVDDFKHGPFPVRGYSDGDATHWMPLPAAPANGGGCE